MQHFHNRNRMARLMSAVAMQPDRLGLGIDEDTCALFERDGSFRVIGKGVVTIVDPGGVTHTNEPDISTPQTPSAFTGCRCIYSAMATGLTTATAR